MGRWVEKELPLAEKQAQGSKANRESLAMIKSELARLTKDKQVGVIAVADLVGIVIDDIDAVLTGEWNKSTSNKTYVGPGYQYASGGAADTTATFELPEELEGIYEVRFAYA